MNNDTERKQIVSVGDEEVISVSHFGRHADELTSEWIMEEIEGKKILVAEYGRGSIRPSGVEDVKDEILFIGVGGGKFDDHIGEEEKRKSSSSRLYAKAKGLADDPGLKWILDKVTMHDKESIGYLVDLSSVIKSANNINVEDIKTRDWFFTALNAFKEVQERSINPDRPALQQMQIKLLDFSELLLTWQRAHNFSDENATIKFLKEEFGKIDRNKEQKTIWGFDLRTAYQVMEYLWPDEQEENLSWLFMGMSWIYMDKREFFAAVNEYYQAGKSLLMEVRGPRNEKLRLVVVRSNNHRIHLVARSRYGNKAGVIIQINDSGNVQIYTDHVKRIRLDEVVAILRYREAEKAGKKIEDWKVLKNTGVLEEIPEWFLHEMMFMILNGSISARDIPPTKLSEVEIINAVRIGINPRLFEPTRQDSCQSKCTSSKKKPCPLYGCGLQRCKEVRKKTYEEKNKKK